MPAPAPLLSFSFGLYLPPSVAGITRQSRFGNSAASSIVPLLPLVNPNLLSGYNPFSPATGSTYTPSTPPQTLTDVTNPNVTYVLCSVTVSGCVGGGETFSSPFQSIAIGYENVTVAYLYIEEGGGMIGHPGIPGIYIDALDETTGVLLDNFFVTGVTGYSPADAPPFNDANVNGTVGNPPVGQAVTITASNNLSGMVTPPPPAIPASDAVFDKWVIMYGNPPGNPTNPSIGAGANNMNLDITTLAIGDDPIYALAVYREPASVWVTGSYESPDIILYNLPLAAGQLLPTAADEIPLNGMCNDKLMLTPGVPYGFAAIVHNSSEFDVFTSVSFLSVQGGTANGGGTLIYTAQNAIIPANGSATVVSLNPFINPGPTVTNPGGHVCAAVCLNTTGTSCQFDAADPANVPRPSGTQSCAAWRNTDTICVSPGTHWQFGLGLGNLHERYINEQVNIQVKTLYVPAELQNNEKVREMAKKHEAIYRNTPAYLIPALRETLKAIELKPTVEMVGNGRIAEDKTAGGFLISVGKEKTANFTVSGDVPKNVKNGDIILVQVTASYPETKGMPANSTEFLEFINVRG